MRRIGRRSEEALSLDINARSLGGGRVGLTFSLMSVLFIDNVLLFGSSFLSNCKEETMPSRAGDATSGFTQIKGTRTVTRFFSFYFFRKKKSLPILRLQALLSSLRRRGSAERFPSVFSTSPHSGSDGSRVKIKDSPSAGDDDDDDEWSPTRFHLDSRSVCRRDLDRKACALCCCNLAMARFSFLKTPSV